MIRKTSTYSRLFPPTVLSSHLLHGITGLRRCASYSEVRGWQGPLTFRARLFRKWNEPLNILHLEPATSVRLTRKVNARCRVFPHAHTRALFLGRGRRVAHREPAAFRKPFGAYIALNLGTRLHSLTQFVPALPSVSSLVYGRQARHAPSSARQILTGSLPLYSVTHLKVLKKCTHFNY